MLSVHEWPKGHPKFKFQTVHAERIEELSGFVTKHVWSGVIWVAGTREEANFVMAEWAVLDFDEGMTLEEAYATFDSFRYVIGVTKSHQLVKKKSETSKEKPACDRFRIALKFQTPIFDLDVYRYNMKTLIHAYGSDPQGYNGAMIWQPCKEIVKVKPEGNLVPVVEEIPLEETSGHRQEKISEYVAAFKRNKNFPPRVRAFLQGRIEEGEKNKELFYTACTLFNMDWNFERVLTRVRQIPGMDAHENLETTLKSAAKRCGVRWT